jgi:hypothetical protein
MPLLRDILLITFLIIVSSAIIVLAGIRDNTIPEKKIDCRKLIGSWRTDVPQEVIEACRKRGVINDTNSKTYYR